METRAKVLIVEDDESQRLIYSEFRGVERGGIWGFPELDCGCLPRQILGLNRIKRNGSKTDRSKRGDIQQAGSHFEKGTVKKAGR